MAGWRDIKKRMLGTVHKTFEVPAVYLSHLNANPIRVDVRVHLNANRSEGEGEFSSAAGFFDATPQIVFQYDQVEKLRQKAIVVVSPSEMYVLGASYPARDGYIRCEASNATDRDISDVLAEYGAVGNGPEWEGILP